MNRINELDLQIIHWDKVAHEKSFTHPVKFDRLHELLPKDVKQLKLVQLFTWERRIHKLSLI